MYISNEIFEWPFGQEDSSGFDEDCITRAHEIWRHAKSRIENNPSNDDKADCISSLKKSVDSRLKALRLAYCLDKLPNFGGKKKHLEKMEGYGIIRHTIIKELFELRNEIEHSDREPPELAKCRSYIDIVWYFLKSTDSLLDMKADTLEYWEGNNKLRTRFYPCEDWRVEFSGYIEEIYLSKNALPGHIKLDNYKGESWGDRTMLVRFNGTPVLDDQLKIIFAREYFSALGFYYEDHV